MNAAPCAFLPGNILIPKNIPLEKWAVIACDQFTSQPEYWRSVRAFAAGQPSTLDMILPEAELDTGNRQERIAQIHASMEAALDGMREYPASYVYVERTLQNGCIRRGVVGVLDLEAYSYQEDAAPVRATERTVVERIPPRMQIRRGAALDLSHALLLCDDDRGELLESLTRKRALLPKLYDFDLMLDGGHITGYLVSGNAAQDFSLQVQAYEQRQRTAGITPWPPRSAAMPKPKPRTPPCAMRWWSSRTSGTRRNALSPFTGSSRPPGCPTSWRPWGRGAAHRRAIPSPTSAQRSGEPSG